MERFFDGILAIHHECIAVVAAHLCAELETVVGEGDEPKRRKQRSRWRDDQRRWQRCEEAS